MARKRATVKGVREDSKVWTRKEETKCFGGGVGGGERPDRRAGRGRLIGRVEVEGNGAKGVHYFRWQCTSATGLIESGAHVDVG
jgi:hypothetical protein